MYFWLFAFWQVQNNPQLIELKNHHFSFDSIWLLSISSFTKGSIFETMLVWLKVRFTVLEKRINKDHQYGTGYCLLYCKREFSLSTLVGKENEMRKSRFSEEQIIGILAEQESGAKVAEVCRRHGVSDATFYKWKSKFGGMSN